MSEMNEISEADALYYGDVDTAQVIVMTNGTSVALDPRIDLYRYADDFRWGRNDAGTLQLALAVLASALGSDHRATVIHEQLAVKVFEKLDSERNWMLSRSFIESTAIEIESGHDLNWVAPAGAYLEEVIR
jgi:Family of unknown function (DUF6166)